MSSGAQFWLPIVHASYVGPDLLRYLLASTRLATTAFASRIARPSSPVRSRHSLATFAQSSCSAQVVALCVCLSASFGVQGIWSGPRKWLVEHKWSEYTAVLTGSEKLIPCMTRGRRARHFAWEQAGLRRPLGRRRRRHIAQELIAAVTLDRGEVVRDQPARTFDCDSTLPCEKSSTVTPQRPSPPCACGAAKATADTHRCRWPPNVRSRC